MSVNLSNSSSIKTYLEEGNQLRIEKKTTEAIEKFLAALELDPNSISALIYLAEIHESQQEFNQASSYCQRVLNLQPDHSLARARQAQIMKKQGNIQEAISAFEAASMLEEKLHLWVYVEWGDALNKNGQIKEAIETYKLALNRNPNHISALNQLSHIYEVKKEYDQAISYLDQLVKLQPENIGFQKRLNKARQIQAVEEKYGKILVSSDFAHATEERKRFQQSVSQLQQSSQPIYLQFGFGRTPFPNFLNLDLKFIEFNTDKPPVPADMHNRIFIFPWLDSPLPIPDNSVDFVFHQDLFEHLSQMQQFLLLAEVWRILKPGCFHRINTPCLKDSMKVHSKFNLGFEGVYRKEWEKWGHVNLITKNMIDEIARIVGYQQIDFNSKNSSVAGVDFTETRPGSDRNDLTGNVFADLMK